MFAYKLSESELWLLCLLHNERSWNKNRIISGGVRYFVKPTCMIATRCLGLKVNTSEGKAVNYFKNWVSVREV